jgi:hypothetical protein
MSQIKTSLNFQTFVIKLLVSRLLRAGPAPIVGFPTLVIAFVGLGVLWLAYDSKSIFNFHIFGIA